MSKLLGSGKGNAAAIGCGEGPQIRIGETTAAPRKAKGGATMSPEEWRATAHVRRELVERDPVAFSRGSDEDRDERVREEVRLRAAQSEVSHVA